MPTLRVCLMFELHHDILPKSTPIRRLPIRFNLLTRKIFVKDLFITSHCFFDLYFSYAFLYSLPRHFPSKLDHQKEEYHV